MKIDAHQHYWRVDRNDYGWLTPEQGCLYADYLPDQLLPYLQEFGIQNTVLVQAAPTIAETEFMLQLSEQHDTIAGVVGWLDFESDHFQKHFERLLQNPKFIGVRPMIQDLPSSWIIGEQVMENLQLLAASGFPLDLQARPRHLPYIIQLLERIPTLRTVVDHLAKPLIWEGIQEPWRTHLHEIAQAPQVMCKLSGMVPEAAGRAWSPAELKFYVNEVLRMFGTKRVMFGSDWPVCLLTASYSEVYLALADNLPLSLQEPELRAIFGENAAAFYRLSMDYQQ